MFYPKSYQNFSNLAIVMQLLWKQAAVLYQKKGNTPIPFSPMKSSEISQQSREILNVQDF